MTKSKKCFLCGSPEVYYRISAADKYSKYRKEACDAHRKDLEKDADRVLGDLMRVHHTSSSVLR